MSTYLSKADMGRRWGVTPQNVNHWSYRHPDFPEPAFRVGNGKIPIYDLEDVKEYEEKRGIRPREDEE